MENKNTGHGNINFICKGDGFEEIPRHILERANLSLPKAHTNKGDIAVLSKEIAREYKDNICKVPFCVTVEAEALGAKINLGDNIYGPRVNEYVFDTIEELKSIREIDLFSGRIKEVLDAIETLSNEGETVCLNVEGPFTIVSSLIKSNTFYKELRKNKGTIDEILEKIKKSIVKYCIEGIRKGAKIISYGDPAGNIDIIGPKIYKDFSGRVSYEILKELEPYLDHSIVSICGKMSMGLDSMGYIEPESVEYSEFMKYGQAILDIIENKKHVKFIGYNCMKNTSAMLNKPIVWEIII